MSRKNYPREVIHHQSTASPFQPSADASVEDQRKSFRLLQSLLFQIVDATNLQLPVSLRAALLESIRRISRIESCPQEMHQHLTEVVMEGLLTCDSLLPEQKNLIVIDGLFEQRWDRVIAKHIEKRPYWNIKGDYDGEDAFLTYRRMFLVLFRSSRQMQQCLPESSRHRIKQMILQTKSEEELNSLLSQILQRMCGIQMQNQIMQDVNEGRYYRLVWQDRLDCEDAVAVVIASRDEAIDDDRKLPAVDTTAASPMVFGSILLPGDLSHGQDCCPICLDPIQAPALQLSCHHVFCSKCISNWIRQDKNVTCSTHSKTSAWHCPVCRQAYDVER